MACGSTEPNRERRAGLAVNFVDSVLIKLAGSTTRGALFDDLSLAQLLTAQYQTDTLNISAPYSAVFDRLELGVSIATPVAVRGDWSGPAPGNHVDVNLNVAGLADTSNRVDAFWSGRIVARAQVGGATVDRVGSNWPDPSGIDAQIIAALGSLPSDPAALETQRRTRYVALLKAGMVQPDALTDDVLDARLRGAGVDSVSAFMAAGGTKTIAAFNVRFTEAPSTSVTTAFPVSFALLVRDAPSISDLLYESKTVRALLAAGSKALVPDRTLPLRCTLGVAWVVPVTLFDDTAWPGADNAARRAAAGAWLAAEGIGLVTAS